MIIQAIVTAIHICWLYIFVDCFEMGASGAGIATSISYFTLVVGLHFYTEKYFDREKKELAWFYPFKSEHNSHCFDKIDGSRQSPEGGNYLYRELKNNLDWKRKI